MPFFRLGKPKNAKKPTPVVAPAPVEPTPDPTPVIVLSPLTTISLQVGTPYTRTFSASGGASPYAYAVASGALPGGLELSGAVLSGTPTTEGAFSFGIAATDANDVASATTSFSGTVAAEEEPPAETGRIALKGGLDGGGWVTGEDIADDGTLAVRTDCAGIAGIRGPTDSSFTQLFRFGDNIARSEAPTKALSNGNVTSWIYEVAIAPSDSDRVYAAFLGHFWRSETGAVDDWIKTNYNGGTRDQTLTFYPHHEARIGGQHMAVHPTDPDIVVLGHPVDGASYSLDGGDTWQDVAGIPAPINSGNERRGVNITYDRVASKWVIVVQGRGVYRASSITDTFALVGTGYPTTSSSVSAANDKIAVCGDGCVGSQLYVYNGSTWSQPTANSSPVIGNSVAFRPGSPSTVLCMDIGGDQCFSSDAGASWTAQRNIAFENDGAECPYLATVNSDYMSLGRFVWHPTEDRITAGNGIGVFQFDSLPRTSTLQLYADKTLGIQQKLVMDMRVQPSGRVLSVAQDKPLYIHERATADEQPTINLPDGLVPIRHGNGIDWAADDDDYLVLTYQPALSLVSAETIMISTEGGAEGSWDPPANVPTYSSGGETIRLHGGNVAVGNTGNIVWAGTNGGPIRVTQNGGASAWSTPTFRATEGGSSIDVSAARWHRGYGTRRQILWGDKATPGRFLVFVGSMIDGGSEVAAPYAGIYESTDNGVNFIRVRDGAVFGFGLDEYGLKMRPVPGYANHLFFARGNVNSFGADPAEGGLKFSTNKGATLVDMPDWAEVEDIGFGQPIEGNAYPRLLVKGYYNDQPGYHFSDDFDPSDPTAATFSLWTDAPMGRADDDAMIAGDMNAPSLFYVVTSAGGFQILKEV